MTVDDRYDDRDVSFVSVIALYAGRLPASTLLKNQKRIQSPVLRQTAQILAENGPIPTETSSVVSGLVDHFRGWAIRWYEVHSKPPVRSKVYRDEVQNSTV